MGAATLRAAVLIDALAERRVTLSVAPDGILHARPARALTPELIDTIRDGKAALLALSCAVCGVIPFTSYTGAGKRRCAGHAPARCRACSTEISHNARSYSACSASPLVAHALAIGARETVP